MRSSKPCNPVEAMNWSASLGLVALLAIGCGAARAQEQERKLIDRIQNPDRTMASPMQGKSFGAAGASSAGAFHGSGRSFGGADKAAVKAFSGTRSFFGIKNPWFGEKVFPAGAAPLGKAGSSALADRVFPVADAAVRTAPQASKKTADAAKVVATTEFAGRGGAQGALDQITDRIQKEMTIDDVRELLNNPR